MRDARLQREGKPGEKPNMARRESGRATAARAAVALLTRETAEPQAVRDTAAANERRTGKMQSAIEGEARASYPFPMNVVEGEGMGAMSGGENGTFERVKTQLKARLGSPHRWSYRRL